jgi:hypothetical protein
MSVTLMGLYGCLDFVVGELVMELPGPKFLIRVERLRWKDANGVVDSGMIEWNPSSGGYIQERVAWFAARRIRQEFGIEVPLEVEQDSEYANTSMRIEEVMMHMLADMAE